jgi:hypothetical protein
MRTRSGMGAQAPPTPVGGQHSRRRWERVRPTSRPATEPSDWHAYLSLAGLALTLALSSGCLFAVALGDTSARLWASAGLAMLLPFEIIFGAWFFASMVSNLSENELELHLRVNGPFHPTTVGPAEGEDRLTWIGSVSSGRTDLSTRLGEDDSLKLIPLSR